jgi:hypothetical protein
MRTLSRTIPVVALAALILAPRLAAQDKRAGDAFKWYIGPQGGVLIFETPNQTRGALPSVGAHIQIMARRTGLLLSFEEAFDPQNDYQKTSFADPSAPGGARQVLFKDLRKYTAALVAYPFRGHLQPFFGLGVGILQTGNEYPQDPGGVLTPVQKDSLTSVANSLGSYGFGTALAGLQARAGGIALFGQAQVMTGPGSGKLLTGASFALEGGIRISLGGAREDVTSGY